MTSILKDLLANASEEISPKTFKTILQNLSRPFHDKGTLEEIAEEALLPLEEEDIVLSIKQFQKNWKVSCRWNKDADWIALPNLEKPDKIVIVDPRDDRSEEEQPTFTFAEAKTTAEAYLAQHPNTEIILHNTGCIKTLKAA